MATINEQGPLVDLQWFATDFVELEGQAEPAPGDGQGEELVVNPAESLFYSSPDGQSYKSREELDKFMTNEAMMRSKFTKSMMELGDKRRQFDSEKAEHDKARRAFEEEMRIKSEEFKSFDEKIRKNPQIYNYLKKQLSDQPAVNTDYIRKLIDEQYGDKFKKVEEWERNQTAEAQKREAIENLKLMYEDFDFDSVDKSYQELMNTASMQSLMEMIYFANKGRSIDPLDVERTITKQIENKKKAGISTTKGSSPPKAKQYANLSEAAEAAKELWNG